jgi:hypothetical protein
MNRVSLCYFLNLFFMINSIWAATDFDDYKSKLEVPEPMFVDLVRSLSAKKGEWEINTLFAHSSQQDVNENGRVFNWAPEVEYVIDDGHAVEFELPSRGGDLKNFKFAYQYNNLSLFSGNHLEGIQLIWERSKEMNEGELTLFYIFAKRLDFNWSFLSMMGVNLGDQFQDQVNFVPNLTLFYNFTREVDFGLETNGLFGSQNQEFWQVIPQIHLALKEGLKIQYGVGHTQRGRMGGVLTSFRLIKEFN